ncbi:hypothetical protein GCM10019016_088240 [Streptomyces prasinosporus]|uniref:Uncharacterized protein n=1 Tax=Streptomyces prasinosporus TaxID=68256 RepID=A0ABP6U4U5_9ACTN
MDDAVMLTGIVRALVETAPGEAAAGVPVPDCAPELLQAAMRHAARHGPGDTLIDPGGRRRRADDVLGRLLRYVAPALDASGDTDEVTALVHRLLRHGTGADRQRAASPQGARARSWT